MTDAQYTDALIAYLTTYGPFVTVMVGWVLATRVARFAVSLFGRAVDVR